jgi:hypothetical protein
VSEGVVDALEPANVEPDHGDRCSFAASARLLPM